MSIEDQTEISTQSQATPRSDSVSKDKKKSHREKKRQRQDNVEETPQSSLKPKKIKISHDNTSQSASTPKKVKTEHDETPQSKSKFKDARVPHDQASQSEPRPKRLKASHRESSQSTLAPKATQTSREEPPQLSSKSHTIRSSHDAASQSYSKPKKSKTPHQESSQPTPNPKRAKTSRDERRKPMSIDPDLPEVLPSPFMMEKRAFYLPLPPICALYPLKGICAVHFSPLIMTYYHPMRGVVLAYENAHLGLPPDADDEGGDEQPSSTHALCVNEYAAPYLWVTADFLVYRPERGMRVEGYVTTHSEGHLGMLCLNAFNASIERKRMPKGWKWVGPAASSQSKARLNGGDEVEDGQGEVVEKPFDPFAATAGIPEDEGYWEDGEGRRIEGRLNFRVKDLIVSRPGDREKGFFGIEGTLLSEEEEKETEAAAKAQASVSTP